MPIFVLALGNTISNPAFAGNLKELENWFGSSVG